MAKRNNQETEDQGGNLTEEPSNSKQRICYANVTKLADIARVITPEKPSLSYKEAISFDSNAEEKELFEKAHDKEVDQLMKMDTWDSRTVYDVHSVPKSRILNSMFIFTTKRDGTKKCRFVARGDQQKPETYLENLQANTVHNYALMTSMEIVLDKDMFMTQLDVSSAYLNAELKEELYIRTPPHMQLPGKVLRLQKSLYGLKQSGANWYQTIREYPLMKETDGWPCVFVENEILVCLFVDDMVLFTKTIGKAKEFIEKLKRRFDTKVVNEGIPDSDGIIYYDILGLVVEYKKGHSMKFGMKNSLTDKLPQLGVPLLESSGYNRTPGQPGMMISRDDIEMHKAEYEKEVNWMQRVTGLASYVAHKYRYDILYYVKVLAQHTLYPSSRSNN